MRNTLNKLAEFGLGDISVNAQLVLAKVPDSTLCGCKLVGLTDERLERAIMISADHKVGLGQIVRYMQRGVTLERVELALGLYVDDFTSRDRASVELLNRFADAFGFSLDGKGHNDTLRDAIAAFQSFFEERLSEKVRAPLPLYWLYHRIVERLDGNFHRALQLVNEDPTQMAELMMSRTGVLAGTSNTTFGRHCNEVMSEINYCAAKAAEAERRKSYEHPE